MAKLELYEAMLAGKVRKADLARKLDCHMPQIDRLLDLRHASRLDQIEEALESLGKRLVVSVADAAWILLAGFLAIAQFATVSQLSEADHWRPILMTQQDPCGTV